ncbi:MAG: hypothetical protein CMJ94_09690 [Planctomycetes bacterium]|nr:hypothetical protein [Planctomycetota bacterium]
MSRAIGFHRLGDETAYALVEKPELAPPQVLAAGRVPNEELAELIDRLDARSLPWGLAAEEDGRMRRTLPADWPLRARGEEVLTAPAPAAAFWDWELGRFDVEDLYLWLSASSLHWSRGLPGRDLAGTIPRSGPLRATLRPALSRAQTDRNPVVLFVEGDAPGADVLEELVRDAGHPLRPLQRPSEEMGADPAAAGVALALLSDSYPALHAPARLDASYATRRMLGIWILLAMFGVFALELMQTMRFEAYREASGSSATRSSSAQQGAAPPPRLWSDLLARRQAVLTALDPPVETERLRSLRIISDPSSAEIRIESEAASQ